MADETKQGDTPKTEPQALTPEQVLAARDALAAQGIHVLQQEQFQGLKGAAAKEAEARADALQAEMDALRKQHEIAAARLKEIDDAGKSEKQLWEERRAEWQRQQAEKDAEIEAARKAHQEAVGRYQQAMVDQRLGLLLKGAVDPELALLAAKHRLPGKLSIDDAGRLVHEDLAGVPRIGQQAESFIEAWWQTQTALRANPTPAGPPTSGAKVAGDSGALDIEPFNPPRGASLSEQMAYARDYQRRADEAKARAGGQ